MDFADVLVLNDDEYRVLHQAAETPKKAVSQDQWLDWGDHTIQVDPIGNKQWVHDTHDGHKRTEARGRGYDAAEVSKLVGWQNSHSGLMPHTEYYKPGPIKEYFFPQTCIINDAWRGAKRSKSGLGKLPAISAMIHNNELEDKSIGQIESEMREHDRTSSARIFSKVIS